MTIFDLRKNTLSFLALGPLKNGIVIAVARNNPFISVVARQTADPGDVLSRADPVCRLRTPRQIRSQLGVSAGCPLVLCCSTAE